MYPTTALFPQRIARGLGTLGVVGVLAACADPSAPARPLSPSSIIIIGGRPIVFNAVLRGIGNPDIKPPTAVKGHLQLKVYDTDAGLVTSWKAVIVNPECESAVLLGGVVDFIQDSEDFPSPEDEADLDLFPPRETLGCGENVVRGVVAIPEVLASRLVQDPESFTAVFFLQGGGALAGTLQLGGPDTSPTR